MRGNALLCAGFKIRQDDGPQGGTPQNPKIKKKGQKTKVFWVLSPDLTPRRRDLSIPGGIFPIRPVSGTENFLDSRPVIFPPNPHPYSGLSLRGAICHAIQATDRRPELRSEVVRSCGGASSVPILPFSSFG